MQGQVQAIIPQQAWTRALCGMVCALCGMQTYSMHVGLQFQPSNNNANRTNDLWCSWMGVLLPV